MEKVTGDSHAGYPRDIDVEDVRIVAQILKKHKDRTVPGASLFDEIVAALLKENQSLRTELKSRAVTKEKTTPSLGWAAQVLQSEVSRQGKHLIGLEARARQLEVANRSLQEEGEFLKEAILAFYERDFPAGKTLPLERELIPPVLQDREIRLSEEQQSDPLEVLTVECYQINRKVKHAKSLIEYYEELPEKVEILREAYEKAQQGHWAELFDEPPTDPIKAVVSDLVVDVARAKNELASTKEENTGLQRELDQAKDTIAQKDDVIARQKFEMGEMQRQIELLQRQLAGANRVIEDQALRAERHSWI